MTTRPSRPEERHGVDYTFLSKEEFIALEKSGELLESGVFDGKNDAIYYKFVNRRRNLDSVIFFFGLTKIL